MLMEAIDKAGHSGVCTVGLDVASSGSRSRRERHDLDDRARTSIPYCYPETTCSPSTRK